MWAQGELGICFHSCWYNGSLECVSVLVAQRFRSTSMIMCLVVVATSGSEICLCQVVSCISCHRFKSQYSFYVESRLTSSSTFYIWYCTADGETIFTTLETQNLRKVARLVRIGSHTLYEFIKVIPLQQTDI